MPLCLCLYTHTRGPRGRSRQLSSQPRPRQSYTECPAPSLAVLCPVWSIISVLLVNHISQPYQYSWSISVVSYTECPLYSKRTHSIVREHILWRLLKEYQYTTHSLSWCDTSNTLYNTL